MRYRLLLLAFLSSAWGDFVAKGGGYGPPKEGTLLIENGPVFSGKGGGPVGGGGGGHHGGGGGYGGDCYPITHFQTHYRTQIQQVPVYKTVVSSQLVVAPYTSVIYDTIYRQRTNFVTETDRVTEYDVITRAQYDVYTSTVERVLYTPRFETETLAYTQNQDVVFTARSFNTVYKHFDVEHTDYETVVVTVPQPVTLTHTSQVVDPIYTTVTDTLTAFRTVLVTEIEKAAAVPIGGAAANLVINTNRIIAYKPSYYTATQRHTLFVTTTNVLRAPVYVTQTLYNHCNPGGGYSYRQPAVPFDIRASGAAATGGGYSLPKPAVPFDFEKAAAAANAASGGGYSYPEPAIAFDIRKSAAGGVGGGAAGAGAGPGAGGGGFVLRAQGGALGGGGGGSGGGSSRGAFGGGGRGGGGSGGGVSGGGAGGGSSGGFQIITAVLSSDDSSEDDGSSED